MIALHEIPDAPLRARYVNSQLVDEIKNDFPFAAGALAQSIGMTRSYGCHFGFRDQLDYCRREFYRGYDAAVAS